MTIANLSEVKSRFSHFTKRVKSGETIILCERNKPIAGIRPLPDQAKPAAKRPLGLLKGLCPVGSEFFAADEKIAADFEASEIFPAAPSDRAP